MKKKFDKLHEKGIPLSSVVNYKVEIEDGKIYINISPLPEDIFVAYELLNEHLQPLDSHVPSYETECSFPLRTLGMWCIRLSFYENQKPTKIRYSFQTISLDFDEKKLLNTFNFKTEGKDFAKGRLERTLYASNLKRSKLLENLALRLAEFTNGYTLADYLVERGMKYFYFYCESDHSDLGKYLYYTLYTDSRIQIKECISQCPYTISGRKAQKPDIKFQKLTSLILDKDIPIFIISSQSERKLEDYLSSRGNMSFSLVNINTEIQRYYKDIWIYKEFKKRNPKVDLILIKRPKILKQSLPEMRSENENYLINNNVNLKKFKDLLNNPSSVYPLGFAEATTLEMLPEFKPPGYHKPANWHHVSERLQDVSGEYVNIKEGRRSTTDQPLKYKNSIYFYGQSFVFSPSVSDKDTSSSVLQRLLIDQTAKPYRVVNCGGYTPQTGINMNDDILNGNTYKTGDKVMVVVDDLPDKEVVDYTFFDLRNVFDRPHNYGNVWLTTILLNAIGEKVIAKSLYEKLRYNKLINEKLSVKIPRKIRTLKTKLRMRTRIKELRAKPKIRTRIKRLRFKLRIRTRIKSLIKKFKGEKEG